MVNYTWNDVLTLQVECEYGISMRHNIWLVYELWNQDFRMPVAASDHRRTLSLPFPSLFSPYTSLCLIRTKSTSVSVPFCVRILVKWQSTVCFEFCQSPGSCYYSLLSSTCSHSLGSKIRGYSSSPESQVLTLADLTPPTSDVNISTRFRNGGSSLGISQPLRSSYPDLRNGTSHLSPRDAEVSGGCPLVKVLAPAK